MWRHIGNSVRGAAHAKQDGPCQDHCQVAALEGEISTGLIACVADGAGSAKFGAEGSAIACESIVDCATAHLKSNTSFDKFGPADANRWCDTVRKRIRTAASARGATPREFATTLCAAILTADQAVFFQIGDGAIIVRRNGVLGVVFWPQSGEYANTTNFLTEEQFEQHLDFLITPGRCGELAMLTDGIERLALKFESQSPHVPFFQPLLDALRTTDDVDGLDADMRNFLESRSVQDRSDDDKTLVLATWVDG